MSKGGGRGSAQQMQQSAFGGGRRGVSSNELRATNEVGEIVRPQFSSAIGGKGGQRAPTQDYGFHDRNNLVPLDVNPSMSTGDPIASDLRGLIPYSPDNASGGSGKTVIGGENLLYQLQPINQPAPKQIEHNYGYPGRTTAGIKPQRDDMAYAGGTPNFDERTGQYRQQPFMPRSFPFQMPPRMPPQIPYRRPSIPGMNTQFQMPSFGRSYGQMNPYAGQFSGYGVPSNMMSFAQPHYQAYTPGSFTPPQQTRYTPTAPPAMQLPPGMGAPTFGGGYGGIGGFDRYNLGLAYDQLF